MLTVWNRQYDRPRLMKALNIEMPIEHTTDAMDCLDGRTRIPLWGGGALPLATIVTSQLTPTIIGLDETGERIPLNIVGHHARRVVKQDWIRISTEGTRFPIVATPEHLVWTRLGWREAQQLQVGDEVASSRIGSLDTIQGSLLGDGSLKHSNAVSQSRTLSIEHGIEQLAYLTAKASHLGAKTIRFTKGGKAAKVDITINESWNAVYYVDGWKQFHAPTTDRALAIWYCDDGHHRVSVNPDALGGAIIALGKYRLQWEQVLEWFRSQFGGHVVHQSRSRITHKVDGRIYVKTKSAWAFFNRIAPYVHPSMDYKLPLEFRGRYDGWLERKEVTWAPIKRITQECRTSTRYCISVDHPTQRFFTHTALVHNCFHVCFNSLPRKLGFATACLPSSRGLRMWKNLSQTEPALYSVLDAVALLRNWYDTQSILQQTGALPVYNLVCRDLDPTLDHMSQRGLLVDRAAKDALEAELITTLAALTAQMNELVPEDVRSPHVWRSMKNAEKGRQTLIDRLRREGDASWEIVAAAPFYGVPGQKKATICSRCAIVTTSAHVKRKTLKKEPA